MQDNSMQDNSMLCIIETTNVLCWRKLGLKSQACLRHKTRPWFATNWQRPERRSRHTTHTDVTGESHGLAIANCCTLE